MWRSGNKNRSTYISFMILLYYITLHILHFDDSHHTTLSLCLSQYCTSISLKYTSGCGYWINTACLVIALVFFYFYSILKIILYTFNVILPFSIYLHLFLFLFLCNIRWAVITTHVYLPTMTYCMSTMLSSCVTMRVAVTEIVSYKLHGESLLTHFFNLCIKS